MSIINQIKDVDELYQSDLIEHEDGTFECPVCHKSYKRKTMAEKHYAKKDCHSPFDLYGNTPYEDSAYGLYQSIIAQENPKARVTMASFRKSSKYKTILNFCVFCYINEVDDFGLYYGFMQEVKGCKMPNSALTKALNEEALREYRLFLHKIPKHVDSDTFWEQYGDELLSDDDFFIRSLEKAHITISSVTKRVKAMERIDSLPLGYQMRVDNLLNEVIGWKL